MGIAKSSPFGKFYFLYGNATLPSVQTINETRRQRLTLLLKSQSMADLNERLGWPRTDSRLSRIKNAVARTDRAGKQFDMGDAMAREIEQKLGLAAGWMDTPPTHAEIYGETDWRAKAMEVMENIPQDRWPTAVRLLDALAEKTPQPA